jgi:F-type H+-transporting ATPase subunit delta
MKDRKVAVRYARALLSAISAPEEAVSVDRFLNELGNAMREPDFRDLMLDPALPRSTRKTALADLVQRTGLDERVTNFLSTLIDNNRIGSLPSIAEVFHEEREKAQGIVPAEITTAVPLTDEMKERARAAVEKLTGRKVRLTSRVEPKLIGGAVTRVGSTVYDGSLRTQLAQLRRKMDQE